MHSSITTVCVCGAGTMGSGIAQVAATAGFPTLLFDLNEAALKKAEAGIHQSLLKQVSKGRMTAAEKDAVTNLLRFANRIEVCRADLIIEAIVENPEAKTKLFQQLAAVNGEKAIYATNTSSLSVNRLSAAMPYPERLAGIHFFNPAPLMKLVEVITATHTVPEVTTAVLAFLRKAGKVPVLCSDAPGFVVNRVARHYYLEALKLAEQGMSDFETIDAVLESAGFKMGPFRLMDLIGNDINLAVTQSLYEACGKPLRFKPSFIQEDMVRAGSLGRKTGKGYYNY
mgnify:CR=1 FL=1